MKTKKILIITSSGGGGLLQAALAKEQEELANDPATIIIKHDMLKEWYGKRVGPWGIKQWDQAQRAGDIKKLKWLYNWQGTADLVFWPRIFYCALVSFFKHKVDRVIDTQPLGTSAIIYAMRIYNFWHKKELILEKVAVDLPTEKNTHFFRPIKKLSKKNRSCLKLIAISPLLRSMQTPDEFWLEHCNLLEREVVYEYVIRRSFFKWKGVKRATTPLILTMDIKNREEQEFVSQIVSRGSLQAEIGDKTARYLINPFDRVATILLGSQPTSNATVNYVKKFILWARANQEKLALFVFCSEHQKGKNSLIFQIAKLISREEDYPQNLTVIPFSMQSDEVIAPLFHRSNITCTRSGGQTAMELMCVTQGEIWVHSELDVAPGERPSQEKLLDGFLGWEAGNALYLYKKFGAKIVAPELVPSLMVEQELQ